MSKFGKVEANPAAIPHAECPAKTTPEGVPGLSVGSHCQAVGALADGILQEFFASKVNLPGGLSALAAAHDIGKVSPGYLLKHFSGWLGAEHPQLLPAGDGFCRKHATVGEATLRAWYQREKASQDWARVVGSHHGSRDGQPGDAEAGIYGGPAWSQERLALLDELVQMFGPPPRDEPRSEHLDLAAGLTCVSDWLGSDERWFPAQGLRHGTDLASAVSRCLDESGWRVVRPREGLGFADLFGPRLEPNEMQQTLHSLADTPGVYVVEAPTGHGKTEAALWAAYSLIERGFHNGIYYALPTRLTSNRIHERVEGFMTNAWGADANARLVHAQAWLRSSSTGGQFAPDKSWFRPLKRALLHPFGVGTIDQALLAVMKVRHSFVRAFGLAGKVVILDEIHSYDIYTGTLLDLLVDLLRRLGSTVIVLSATLTRARRAELLGTEQDTVAYPLITAEKSGRTTARDLPPPALKSVKVSLRGWTLKDAADAIAARVASGHSVIWILNTVADAQEAYRILKAAVRTGDTIGLLHSRFPAWRREELETEWLSRLGKDGDRIPCALVATQVIEQSVDVDVDFMVTDLAPSDMLVQRAGRLWRHSRPSRPCDYAELVVRSPDLDQCIDAREYLEALGGSRYVYCPYVMWRSWRAWRSLEQLTSPGGIRPLLETTYRALQRDDPAWAEDLHTEAQLRKEKLRKLATSLSSNNLCALDDDERAATRYSSRPTIDVLLLKQTDSSPQGATLTLSDGTTIDASAFAWSYEAGRSIHTNIVSVGPGNLMNPPETPRWLARHMHGGAVPLLIGEDGRLTMLDGRPTRLSYDDFCGVRRVETSTEEEAPNDESDW